MNEFKINETFRDWQNMTEMTYKYKDISKHRFKPDFCIVKMIVFKMIKMKSNSIHNLRSFRKNLPT